MGYVDQSLVTGEKIIIRAKMHWAVFMAPLFLFLLGFIAIPFSQSKDGSALACLFGLFFLAGIWAGLQVTMIYLTTEFALTNKRIIGKKGWIRRSSLEILLGKVESIGVRQPIMGRILNYGTITLSGSGGTKQSFPYIALPMELRQKINAQIGYSVQ
jgi:uncharacterized membrane protein YdbT with pleckstrin-like domain